MLNTDCICMYIDAADYFCASSFEYNLVLYVIAFKPRQICFREIMTMHFNAEHPTGDLHRTEEYVSRKVDFSESIF